MADNVRREHELHAAKRMTATLNVNRLKVVFKSMTDAEAEWQAAWDADEDTLYYYNRRTRERRDVLGSKEVQDMNEKQKQTQGKPPPSKSRHHLHPHAAVPPAAPPPTT